MSEYAAAAAGAGTSRWPSRHLGPTDSAILASGQNTGPEPYSRFGRKDEGPESIYRPGPGRSDYEHPSEDLGTMDQPERYGDADFRAPVCNSSGYGRWPIQAGAHRPGSI